MFLGNVLFLTRVWDYSILRAGLAISVGPLIVAVTAPFFGRLAGRIGQRRAAHPRRARLGRRRECCLLARADHHAGLRRRVPARRTSAPPSASPCCLPQLSSAAVQGLPADQFGAGSAVVQAVRYLGSTLGVALAIALLDRPSADALDGFHHVWWLLVAVGITVSIIATRLARRPATAGAPAVALALD